MNKEISERRVECPHCGHHIHVVLDASAGDQNYYDECPACCCDIHLNLHVDELNQVVELTIDADDEQVF